MIDHSRGLCGHVLEHPLEDVASHVNQHDPLILVGVLLVGFDCRPSGAERVISAVARPCGPQQLMSREELRRQDRPKHSVELIKMRLDGRVPRFFKVAAIRRQLNVRSNDQAITGVNRGPTSVEFEAGSSEP